MRLGPTTMLSRAPTKAEGQTSYRTKPGFYMCWIQPRKERLHLTSTSGCLRYLSLLSPLLSSFPGIRCWFAIDAFDPAGFSNMRPLAPRKPSAALPLPRYRRNGRVPNGSKKIQVARAGPETSNHIFHSKRRVARVATPSRKTNEVTVLDITSLSWHRTI